MVVPMIKKSNPIKKEWSDSKVHDTCFVEMSWPKLEKPRATSTVAAEYVSCFFIIQTFQSLFDVITVKQINKEVKTI